MLYALIVKTIWSQEARTGAGAEARRRISTQAWPIAAGAPGPLVRHLVRADEAQAFEPVSLIQSGTLATPATTDCPFHFRAVGEDIEIHFNRQYESGWWRPPRFSRDEKPEKGRTAWQRPSILFSLAPGQRACFRVNYYHGRRKLLGGAMKPGYHRFDASFGHCRAPTPDLFKGQYDFVRDEVLPLR